MSIVSFPCEIYTWWAIVQWQRVCLNKKLKCVSLEQKIRCFAPQKSLTFRFLGGKSRDAVIGTKDFPAYPQNKNSCAHAVRSQPVAAPLSSSLHKNIQSVSKTVATFLQAPACKAGPASKLILCHVAYVCHVSSEIISRPLIG